MKRFVKRFVLPALEERYWRACGCLRNPPLPAKPGAVLFVCKGNVCRSPYAELVAPRLLPAAGRKPARVESAGIEVDFPSGPPEMAVAAAALRGVDMASHCSRPIRPGELADFDMIFAMEAAQSRWLKRRHPRHAGKVFLLPLFDPLAQAPGGQRRARYIIEDPFGKPFAAYCECFERIERCLAAAGRCAA